MSEPKLGYVSIWVTTYSPHPTIFMAAAADCSGRRSHICKVLDMCTVSWMTLCAAVGDSIIVGAACQTTFMIVSQWCDSTLQQLKPNYTLNAEGFQDCSSDPSNSMKIQHTQNQGEQMVSLNIKQHSVCVNTEQQIELQTDSAPTCWITKPQVHHAGLPLPTTTIQYILLDTSSVRGLKLCVSLWCYRNQNRS